MSLLSDLGTKIGAEFKAHRLRIETLENDTGSSFDNGGTMTGDLILTATNETTRMIQIGKSTNGTQGTGVVEVTQDGAHGGGMMYNGDGTPGFASGEGSDKISFYRNANNSRSVVFQYSYNSDNVYFNGKIYSQNNEVMTGNKTISTSTPSGGSHGDVWYQV
jgi:2-phospho-L-lactate transferase/gluconeogenesis factor (CofD/UPF0052 family)